MANYNRNKQGQNKLPRQKPVLILREGRRVGLAMSNSSVESRAWQPKLEARGHAEADLAPATAVSVARTDPVSSKTESIEADRLRARFQVRHFTLNEIVVRSDHRPSDFDRVRELALSIAEIGLRTPITVMPCNNLVEPDGRV